MPITRSTEARGALIRALGALALGAVLVAPAFAQGGDKAKGAQVYAMRCAWCHGEKGDGQGPGAARLVPPPRDFTLGLYKIKTSGFEEIGAREEDLVRMIRDGMPGTAMPGWKDLLSEQDIRDVIAHLASFVELEKPKTRLDFGAQVASSAESIDQGRKLFLDGERCSECHGKLGKGDGIKSLKDDAGFRTWPRNLTKPWTFRASNDPRDVFARISNGIPGTQMPAFADPAAKEKRLTVEQRWHIANFVASLGKTEARVRPERTVIRASRIEGELPTDTGDAKWNDAEPATFYLVPQLIAKERFFTPSNDTITVRALYGARDVALLLEWDDRTRSIPGDEQAGKIADGEMSEDAVAVQLPVEIPKGMEKPYFVMGDPGHPVMLWQWRSGTTTAPEAAGVVSARGMGKIEKREPAGLLAKGSYRDGTWRVVMKRALAAADPGSDISFAEGTFIPIAFAAWDGSNGEKDSRHTLTTWYWLLLEPARGNRPAYAAASVFVLLLGMLWLWARGAATKRAGQGGGA